MEPPAEEVLSQVGSAETAAAPRPRSASPSSCVLVAVRRPAGPEGCGVDWAPIRVMPPDEFGAGSASIRDPPQT